MKRLQLFLIFACLLSLSACGSGGATSPTSPINSNPTAPTDNNGNSDAEVSYPDYNTDPLPADDRGMHSNAQQLAEQMTLGWNIGNTMEATDGETAWGNPAVSAELIQLVKSTGFDAIRIPLSWDQYADQQSAEISHDWLARVKQVVQYCVDNGLYVIVNIHWDGGWLENNVSEQKQQANNAKQKAFWQQIATQLRDFDQHVLFASANEPNVENAQQMQVLLTYHQTFVDAVRSTGGKNAYRVLVVQGPSTDIEKTASLWTGMPEDSVAQRLMAEVHFYTPYNYTLMTENQSWGNPFFYWGSNYHSATDTDHNATWGEEDEVNALFSQMKSQFVDHGIPIVLGEFSAMRRTELEGEDLQLHLAARAYYHQYVVAQARKNGLIPFYWDNGGLDNFSSGLFDRQNLRLVDHQVMDAMLAAGNSNQ